MIDRRTALAGIGAMSAAPLLARLAGTAPERAKVLVLGAGLSGLYSALLLEQAGYKVIVLEGRDRVGGRLVTHDDVPGTPEGGGRTLAGSYARAIDLMNRFELERYPVRAPEPSAIAFRGSLMAASDWATSPVNPVRGEWRAVPPPQLYTRAMHKLNPLRQLTDWSEPARQPLDTRSIAADFAARGIDANAIALMDVAFDGRSLAEMSALFAYRKQVVSDFDANASLFRVKGGSARLPRAMASALKTEIRFGKTVRAIDLSRTGVEVACADGSRFAADHAIVSFPFAVLRDVIINPAPPPAQRAIIAALPYTPITIVELGFDRPFWKEDGLPPALWSDAAFERVLPTESFDGELHTLSLWVNGTGALKLDALPPAAAERAMVEALARVRPSSKRHVRVLRMTRWSRDPFARGAYHAWGPGQVAAYSAPARQPHLRLRFVGEHLADLLQGMEAALETGERETLSLMEML